MYANVLKLFVYLLCLKINEVLAASRRLIDQRDMSEHCRRRVMPSVFLGQHVMSANSHVMQFSQLELPYSCSLSVRAESGSNIILVVELLSEDILRNACTLSGDQLIVYELGETFGGYWGPIPNTIMNGSPKNYTQYYTLKTTRRPTPSKRKPQSTLEKILKQTDTQSTVKEQEYYTMNVPIVNISGNFQLGPPREANYEELFNYIYDVTPRNGVEYETSIMPLVQFSIREQKGVGEQRLYELDYNPKGVTMDPRLIFNTAKKKKTPFKKDWKVNKLFRHGTKSDMFRRRGYKKLFTARTPYINKVTTILPTLDSKYLKKSWELVDDIVKSINMTTVRSTVFENETFRNILNNISKLQHNSSVYLARNISIYNDISAKESDARFKYETDSNQTVDNSNKFDQTKTRELDMFTTSLQNNSEQRPSQVTLDLSEMETERDLGSKNVKIDILGNTGLERIQKEVINISTEKITLPNEDLKDITTLPNTFPSTNKSTKTSFLTGAMVDHESWENIVQAAPVMAVVLNKTEPLINDTVTDVFNKSKHKRHIQSLEIDQSRPRNLTAKPALVTDAPQIEDIHDLARMIELDDDELSSRVALRYLRHYAGPALYNLCDIREHSLRQIFLFNSSRIVISVSNFTLDRLMLVLTPAQTLNSGVSQCPEGQLECQIVGTRVCIDSLNACDGVPNCGSYEIYDEDRLTCGTSHGVQRSVCLAALSFLAVILTAAYIILYWLEKCVPRVSDAFFVYTDSSENELFLDSIMRSPNDDDDPSYKINLPGHFFDDDALYQDINAKENKVLFLKKIFNACWKFLGLKKNATEKPSQNDIPENQLTPKEPTRMFSFTQLELKKFGRIEFKEKGVQTGDIFEMQESNIQQNKQEQNSLDSWKRLKEFQYRHDNRSDSELNLLKFSKDSKSLSSQCDSTFYENPNTMKRQAVGIGTDGELEIRNTLYENVVTARKIPVTCEVHTETKRTGESSKRLRFDEELKMISAIEEDNNRSSSYIKRLNNEDSDNITDVPDVASPGRDFMRFWGGKGKKSKKKKLKHLSML